jgi:hypothetical protein
MNNIRDSATETGILFLLDAFGNSKRSSESRF